MQQVSPTNTTAEALEDWEPPAVTEYVIGDVTESGFVGIGGDNFSYS